MGQMMSHTQEPFYLLKFVAYLVNVGPIWLTPEPQNQLRIFLLPSIVFHWLPFLGFPLVHRKVVPPSMPPSKGIPVTHG